LQLEQLLKPVLAAWSENRSRQIDALFAAHVTGPLLQEADERIARAEELEREVRAALEALANAEDSHGT